MEKMFLEPGSLSLQNSSDAVFSASEMEVKLVEVSQRDDGHSVDEFALAFFLARSTQVNPGILSPTSRSIPFGRIMKGSKVIETLIKLTPDERKDVKVRVGYTQEHPEGASGRV